jgi:threonyl-tRNA synthetase
LSVSRSRSSPASSPTPPAGSTAGERLLAADPTLGDGLVAARVNGVVRDLSAVVAPEDTVEPVRDRDPEGLEILRHSTAHLLAQALKDLYPGARLGTGPAIEDGFYYDVETPTVLREEDLPKIEGRMHELARAALPVVREELTRAEAEALMAERGESYKLEILRDLPSEATISVYRQGEFVDLCRGPHVADTSRLRVFRLTRLAGAYWRGDSDRPMLTRIYGTAWAREDDLEAHLTRLAEAEKRDHRRLGRAMDLFHLQEEAPGMVFWHERGWVLYRLVEDYVRGRLLENGYAEVHTPMLLDRSLWERSGHAEKFATQMFVTGSENREFAVKPMNCPAHVQIFNQGLRSYRELPLRLAEFGVCHRNEPSGTLHGLLRVRSFVQDDAHIFCTPDQIEPEVGAFIDLLFSVYRDFGFEEVTIKLSTRPEARVGDDALWDRAERALADVLDHKGLAYELQPGEGAFYGPKIEFSLRDCLGRVWQCGTMQLDFFLPERLGASYVAETGEKRTPVMLHRAILGSLERFVGVLLEHYAGVLPLWLAPVQASVLTITSRQDDYARRVVSRLEAEGFRVVPDLRNEKIGLKIRERTLERIPYLFVVGGQEESSGSVSVRTHDGRNLGVMTLDNVIDVMKREARPRSPNDGAEGGRAHRL